MYLQKDKDDFIQWCKNTGKAEYKLTDIYVNNNGELELEKKMAWVFDIVPEDWKRFCKNTNREYIGEVNLLAMF